MESENLKLLVSNEGDSFNPLIASTPDIEMEMKKFTINEFKIPHESDMAVDTTPTDEIIEHSYDATMNSAAKNRTSEDTTMNSKVDDLSVDYLCDKHVVELSRCTWRGSSKYQRFLKGCIWSPDGTCLLTVVNGDGMHVFELPSDLYNVESIANDRPLDILQSVVHIKEGGTVYDYCWYPFMNSSNPASCW